MVLCCSRQCKHSLAYAIHRRTKHCAICLKACATFVQLFAAYSKLDYLEQCVMLQEAVQAQQQRQGDILELTCNGMVRPLTQSVYVSHMTHSYLPPTPSDLTCNGTARPLTQSVCVDHMAHSYMFLVPLRLTCNGMVRPLTQSVCVGHITHASLLPVPFELTCNGMVRALTSLFMLAIRLMPSATYFLCLLAACDALTLQTPSVCIASANVCHAWH